MNSIDNSTKENLKQKHKSIRNKREKLRADNPNSIRLGVYGIIYCIVAILPAYPIAWLTVKCMVLTFSGIFLVLVGNLLLFAISLSLPFLYIKLILVPSILYPINLFLIVKQ